MGRQPRVDAEGIWHHVMNRGARRTATFLDDIDRTNFLATAGCLDARYGLEIHAFCLMGNHYHLLARSRDGDLSPALQYLSGIYTRRFNERHGFDGGLFRGRFLSVLIRDTEQLITTARYIHRNPLDIEGLDNLADYAWSSYRSYIGTAPSPRWLHRSTIRELVGSRSDHRHLVESPRGADAAAAVREIETPAAPERVPPSIGDVAAAVAAVASIDPVELLASRPGVTNVARLVAMWIASYDIGLSAADIAEHFGLTSSAVRSGLSRGRAAMECDGEAISLRDRSLRLLRRRRAA